MALRFINLGIKAFMYDDIANNFSKIYALNVKIMMTLNISADFKIVLTG